MAEVADGKSSIGRMIVLHRYYRAHLAQAPALVNGLVAGNQPRIRLILGHVYAVVRGFENHNRDEDDLLWPLLRDRIGTPEPTLRMQDQHRDLESLTARTREALSDLFADPELSSQDSTVKLLTELAAAADAHMTDEEQLVLPLAADHLTAADWAEYFVRGISKMDKAQRRYAYGAMLAFCTPEERKLALAQLPLGTRWIWGVRGQRAYRRHMARIHHG